MDFIKKSFSILLSLLILWSGAGIGSALALPRSDKRSSSRLKVNYSPFSYEYSVKDLSYPSVGPRLELNRYYSELRREEDELFGRGWSSNFSLSLEVVNEFLLEVKGFRTGPHKFLQRGDGIYYDLRNPLNTILETSDGYRMELEDGRIYQFDPQGRISFVGDKKTGAQLRFKYTGDRLRKVENKRGQCLEFQYGKSKHVKKVISYTEDTITYRYENDRLVSVTDLQGGVTRYRYSNGALRKIIHPGGSTELVRQERAKKGENGKKRIFLENRFGGKISYTKNKEKNSITVEKNGKRRKIRIINEGSEGKKIVSTDFRGNKTRYWIGKYGKATKIVYPDGRTFRYGYDKNGNLTELIGPSGEKQTIEYNKEGRPLKYLDSQGNKYRYRYDEKGNLKELILPDDRTFEFAYLNGLLREKVSPDGTKVKIRYNDMGLPVERVKSGFRYRYEYNSRGNLVKKTFPNGTSIKHYYQDGLLVKTITRSGAEISYSYDEFGRLARKALPSGLEVVYDYTSEGRIRQIRYGDDVTYSYKYDDFGSLVEITNPKGRTYQYSYNTSGNVLKKVGFDKSATTFTYDQLGRLAEKVLPNGDKITYSYDKYGRRYRTEFSEGYISRKYNCIGKIKELKNEQFRIEFSYNKTGQLTAKTYYNRRSETEEPSLNIRYRYDESSRLQSKEFSGESISIKYDEKGRPVRYDTNYVGDFKLEYSSGNQIGRINYPNGIVADYDYTNSGQVKELTYREVETGATVAKFKYSYDKSGNVVRNNAWESTYSYKYDKLSRITGFEQNGQKDHSIDYFYDEAGNRVKKEVPNASTRYEYKGGKLVQAGSAEFVYNENGSVIQIDDEAEKLKLSYNGLGLLDTATDTESTRNFYHFPSRARAGWKEGDDRKTIYYDGKYLLDGDFVSGFSQPYGLLPNRKAPSQRNVGPGYFNSKNPLLELGPDGRRFEYFSVGLDRLLARNINGKRQYFLRNGNGSIVGLMDSSGKVIWHNSYEPFGQPKKQVGDKHNSNQKLNLNFQYKSKRFDDKTGLYYYRTRNYLPTIGRFLSRDGFPIKISSPLEYNRYQFNRNNPLRFEDPYGRIIAPVAVGAAAGAGFGALNYSVDCWQTGEEFDWYELGVHTGASALTGAGMGLAVGSGVGFLGTTALGAVASGAGYTIRSHFSGNETFNTGDLLLESAVGGLATGVAGILSPVTPQGGSTYSKHLFSSGGALLVTAKRDILSNIIGGSVETGLNIAEEPLADNSTEFTRTATGVADWSGGVLIGGVEKMINYIVPPEKEPPDPPLQSAMKEFLSEVGIPRGNSSQFKTNIEGEVEGGCSRVETSGPQDVQCNLTFRLTMKKGEEVIEEYFQVTKKDINQYLATTRSLTDLGQRAGRFVSEVMIFGKAY